MGRGGGRKRSLGSPGVFSPVRSTSSASRSRAFTNANRAGARPTTPIASSPVSRSNRANSHDNNRQNGMPHNNQQQQYRNQGQNSYGARPNPMPPGGGFGGGMLRQAGAAMLGVMGASYLMNALRGHEGAETREEAQREVETISNGPCGDQFKTLLQCMEYNQDNVSNCQWTSDIFNNCQKEENDKKESYL